MNILAPIRYEPDFLKMNADTAFERVRDEPAWVRHGTTPRMEYFVSRVGKAYSYGVKEFARTYEPQPSTHGIDVIWKMVEMYVGVNFDVCFLNRYLNQSDHLGWHSDNSPEMDDARPIAVVSLGVAREIMFRSIDPDEGYEKLLLAHGSLLVMSPGMQDTHQHRIPKSNRQCGERISLTFRGYVEP